MDLDDHVCLCFRVSRRKLENYVRLHRPKVASQLSGCGGAGTGCGWCVPFLKQIHRKGTAAADVEEVETVTAAEYAERRAEHIRSGKGTPPPGGHSAGPKPRRGEEPDGTTRRPPSASA